MKGTTFNNIHTGDDLGLLQAAVEVSPAEPKTKYLEIDGGDGSLDLTEALGRTYYKDRSIKWTLKILPGQNWPEKQTETSNALNGRAFHIILDQDPEYYYTGRVTVNNYETDKTLGQITLEAQVRPWKYRTEETISSIQGSGTIRLRNGRKPACPIITATEAADIETGGKTYHLEAGEWQLVDIQLQPGVTDIKVTSTGKTSFKYQEGDL